MKKIFTGIMMALGAATGLPLAAFAHVVVLPSQADVGASTAFTVSVPNERQDTMTSLKLAIPRGVTNVMPNVIAGWEIATEKSGDDVTSITWTGTIPSGQRADLGFKAQVPAASGALNWKAYQSYADGTVVSWDQNPTAQETDNDAATSGPYSITNVTDDLSKSAVPTNDYGYTTLALVLSVIAIVFSVITLLWKRRS